MEVREDCTRLCECNALGTIDLGEGKKTVIDYINRLIDYCVGKQSNSYTEMFWKTFVLFNIESKICSKYSIFERTVCNYIIKSYQLKSAEIHLVFPINVGNVAEITNGKNVR